MEWIDAKELPPTKEDSPILAYQEGSQNDVYGFLNMEILRWENGCDGEGWYDNSKEYAFEQLLAQSFLFRGRSSELLPYILPSFRCRRHTIQLFSDRKCSPMHNVC